MDPEFAKNIAQIVLLGGAFAINGNANPAAEANIFGDPDTADVVFTSGADILAVGINVTHQVVLSGSDREKLASSKGKFAQYLTGILEVYFSYHYDAYNTKKEEDKIKASGETSLKYIIMDMSAVGNIDTSGINMLEEINKIFERREQQLVLVNPGSEVMKKLSKSDFQKNMGEIGSI